MAPIGVTTQNRPASLVLYAGGRIMVLNIRALSRAMAAATSAALLLTVSLAGADAQNASRQPRAGGVSTIGPWEAVLWTAGGTVDHCTLIRAGAPAEGPHYGFLVDSEVTILSVQTTRWQLPRGPQATAVLKPASGTERRLPVKPSAPGRANIHLDQPAAVLAELQSSQHLDVRIGEVALRLAFDDFNAARVVLEACVQKIGKEHKADAPAPR